jgi:hypothetical protein
MQELGSENATKVRWAREGDPSAPLVRRSDRDERAVKLACHLLMVGIALERQVITLVRARSRS